MAASSSFLFTKPKPLKLFFFLLLEGHPIGSMENLSSWDLPSQKLARRPPPAVACAAI